MPDISRRSLLTAATIALISGGGTAAAAAAAQAGRKPRPRSPLPAPRDTGAEQGNAAITVSPATTQDVTKIQYTITDVGSAPDTFTVWYTDQNNGRQSRKLTYTLDPGDSASDVVYGPVNHSFVINVCQSDGSCFTVGPVGPGPSASNAPARGLNTHARR